MSLLGILLSLWCHQTSQAEYRAFHLKITNASTGKTREVSSTLDQYQYPTYYPLESSESIEYLSSWKCWNRSDHFQPVCPNPKEENPEQKPISTESKDL